MYIYKLGWYLPSRAIRHDLSRFVLFIYGAEECQGSELANISNRFMHAVYWVSGFGAAIKQTKIQNKKNSKQKIIQKKIIKKKC